MHFHKWGKWEEFKRTCNHYPDTFNYVIGKIKPITYSESWQKRECLKCGFIQQKKIKE